VGALSRPSEGQHQRSGPDGRSPPTSTPFGQLLTTPSQFAAAFLRIFSPGFILGLMPVKRVPPNVFVGQLTTAAQFSWVGESAATPCGLLGVETAPLRPLKLSTISVVTKDLARFSVPGAVEVISQEFGRAVEAAGNTSVLDPSLSAIPTVRPASLTHGATEITPSGSGIDVDVALLLAAVSSGNPSAPFLVMSPRSALYLATRRASNGERLFPDIGFAGGSIFGGAGDRVVAIDAAGVALTDMGTELDASEEAALQMLDNPTNDSGGSTGSPLAPSTSTDLVSLWQSNSLGLKATRFMNWTRRDDAVAYLELSGSPLP
jgi:hypothetical protein